MKLAYKKYFMTTALIWASCFIVFVFAYMLVLAPQNESKKEVEEQLSKKMQVYSSALQAAQEETKTRLNKQIEDLRDTLKEFVVDFEGSANLTFEISQIAKERRITPSTIEVSQEVRGGSVIPDCKYISENRIDISFLATNFNQFAVFLNALERHRPVIFVDSFKIIRAEKRDSGHRVEMSLSVFVRKRQEG